MNLNFSICGFSAGQNKACNIICIWYPWNSWVEGAFPKGDKILWLLFRPIWIMMFSTPMTGKKESVYNNLDTKRKIKAKRVGLPLQFLNAWPHKNATTWDKTWISKAASWRRQTELHKETFKKIKIQMKVHLSKDKLSALWAVSHCCT